MPGIQPTHPADVLPIIFYLRRALGQAEAAIDAGNTTAEAVRASIDEDTEAGLREVMGWRDATVFAGLNLVATGLDGVHKRIDSIEPVLARGVAALEVEVAAKQAQVDVERAKGMRWSTIVGMVPVLLADVRVWRGLAAALLVILGATAAPCVPSVERALPVIEAIVTRPMPAVEPPVVPAPSPVEGITVPEPQP